jgi:hypothetical protein
MWNLFQNAILTRDMISFALLLSELEFTQHLFFGCFVAKVVWGAMQKVLVMSANCIVIGF